MHKTEACFWCEPAVYHYDPCPTCEDKMSQGITLFEADDAPYIEGQPAIETTPSLLYPSGKYLVVSEDVVDRVLPPIPAEALKKQKTAFVDSDFFSMFYTTKTLFDGGLVEKIEWREMEVGTHE